MKPFYHSGFVLLSLSTKNEVAKIQKISAFLKQNSGAGVRVVESAFGASSCHTHSWWRSGLVGRLLFFPSIWSWIQIRTA